MDPTQLSEAKRRLLDKYIHGNCTQPSAIPHRIPRRPDGEPVPLSFSQQQVWVHSQMAGDIPIYNEAITIYRRGSVNLGVLEHCLAEIIRRHEIWRTTFDTFDGKPFQIIQPPINRFPLKTIDLRHLHEPDREREAPSLATEDAQKPFSLREGPLL